MRARSRLFAAAAIVAGATVSACGSGGTPPVAAPAGPATRRPRATLMLTRKGLSPDVALATYPTLAASRAAAEKRLVIVEDLNLSLALSSGSVLSIPYAVQQLVPLLNAVIG